MKTDELEIRLRAHSRRVKECMASPFEDARAPLRCSDKNERMENTVISRKIIAVIMIAAALACVGTAFAASAFTSWGSFPAERFDSLPAASVMEAEIGYAPVLIERFENGYSYKTGYVVDNELSAEDSGAVERFRSASLVYEREGESVWFSQEKYPGELEIHGEVLGVFDGVEVYFFGYMNKVVPEDYEMSEEDKAAEASGELVFSWGSDSVRLIEISSVQWKIGEINYNLLQMGGPLSPEELVSMAAEAIACTD